MPRKGFFSSSSSNNKPKKEWTKEELHKKFSTKFTLAECRRFADECPKDPVVMMNKRLEWRIKFRVDDPTKKDSSIQGRKSRYEEVLDDGWCNAVYRVLDVYQNQCDTDSCGNSDESGEDEGMPMLTARELEHQESLATSYYETQQSMGEDSSSFFVDVNSEVSVPQFDDSDGSCDYESVKQVMYLPRAPNGDYLRDVHGQRVAVIYPGLVDLEKMTSQQYADAITVFIENNLDTEKDEKVCVCVDVRPGPGWPNPTVMRLMSFIRFTANTVHDLNPDRLHACVLFPIPRIAIYLYKFIKPIIDPTLREYTVLAPSTSLASPLPKCLEKYLSRETLDHLDTFRKRLEDPLCYKI